MKENKRKPEIPGGKGGENSGKNRKNERFCEDFSKKTLTKYEHGPIIEGNVSYTHLTHSRRRQKGGGKRFPTGSARGLRRNLAF